MSTELIHIAIDWQTPPSHARIRIINGNLSGGRVSRGDGTFRDVELIKTSDLPLRLELGIEAHNLAPGANPTMVQVRAKTASFSLLPRDVSTTSPICIPAYGVAVTLAEDSRSFSQIRDEIARNGWQTTLQR